MSLMNLDWIRKIPKTDLHVHLDGSLRLSTLIELAKRYQVQLPSYTEEGLRNLVFKENYADLAEYLQGFAYTCAVMRHSEALEQISYELAMDNFAEGVRYIEPRFDPQLCATESLSIQEVLQSVNRGLEKAKKEINQRKEIRERKEPPFEYGIIGCALRKFEGVFSPYYAKFISTHSYTPLQQVYPIASLELVRALVEIRDCQGIPIVGFDLAGEEKGWPAAAHRRAFEFAHQHFLNKTIHAGEAYGPASIFQAITLCHTQRIGHGLHLFASHLVEHLSDPKEREKYTRDLIEFIAEQRITIEVCLSSNLQTNPEIQELKNHPCKQMLKEKLSVSFCTDNRLVSHTSVSQEIEKAVQAFQLSPKQLKDIISYGFKRSFMPVNYAEKRAYVHQVMDYYESLEASEQTVD